MHDLVRIRLFFSFGRAGGAGDGGVDGVRARDGADGRAAAASGSHKRWLSRSSPSAGGSNFATPMVDESRLEPLAFVQRLRNRRCVVVCQQR